MGSDRVCKDDGGGGWVERRLDGRELGENGRGGEQRVATGLRVQRGRRATDSESFEAIIDFESNRPVHDERLGQSSGPGSDGRNGD